MLAHVGETLLHDPEDLDLLVGREADRRVDLELDLEHAVGGEEFDVTPQRGVERCGSAGGGEGQDCEARFLLREQRRLLQTRRDLLDRRAGFEHGGVGRDCKEVLRETVVDLPRDACALLGHRAPELGESNRAPGADENQEVGEHPQEVALRDGGAREQRLEDEVERCEEHEREAEREPAREVVLPLAEALAPTDHGDESDQRL